MRASTSCVLCGDRAPEHDPLRAPDGSSPVCPSCADLEASFVEPFDRLVSLTAASAIPIDRPQWAWQNRFPIGGVSLVPGREGDGKTALLCHVCARWTRGDLPGERYGRPGDVIYIGHEDDRATVLVPRLTAAGADLDRFHFVDLPRGAMFSLSIDLDALEATASTLDVVGIVVDPVDAHLGVQDTHRKAEVQASLARLATLTQRIRCAGIGIAHFNKGDATDVLRKVVGSVGLTTSVRSVLAVGPHPEHPDDEKVAVLSKANMTDRFAVPAMRFRVESATVPHPDGGTVDTARVVLLGEQLGIDADAILSAGEKSDDQHDAADVLRQVLADGAVWVKDALDAMAEAGFSKDQTKRAKSRLKAHSVKVGAPGDAEQGWKWELPHSGQSKGAEERTRARSAPFAPLGSDALPSRAEECEESEVCGATPSDSLLRPSWDDLERAAR